VRSNRPTTRATLARESLRGQPTDASTPPSTSDACHSSTNELDGMRLLGTSLQCRSHEQPSQRRATPRRDESMPSVSDGVAHRALARTTRRQARWRRLQRDASTHELMFDLAFRMPSWLTVRPPKTRSTQERIQGQHAIPTFTCAKSASWRGAFALIPSSRACAMAHRTQRLIGQKNWGRRQACQLRFFYGEQAAWTEIGYHKEKQRRRSDVSTKCPGLPVLDRQPAAQPLQHSDVFAQISRQLQRQRKPQRRFPCTWRLARLFVDRKALRCLLATWRCPDEGDGLPCS
jgi:hypothetical protein